MTSLPKSEWPALRELARIAWKRIVLRDLERTQTQMEEMHQSKTVTDEQFSKHCDFDKRQTDWYFTAFAGPCPERAVFDAYWDGVLVDQDFDEVSNVLIAQRDRYIAMYWSRDNFARMDVSLMDSLDREKRSLYLD